MKYLIICVALLNLISCAVPSKPGNYAPTMPDTGQNMIAGETTQKIKELYPPAKTRFVLLNKRTENDLFGNSLVENLRNEGYAIEEEGGKNKTDSSGLPLKYVLDFDQISGYHRVIIHIGDKSITRPYIEQNGNLIAAGYWVRKE